jgi:translation initiation factor 2 gamma subunit (eIF-2gamma)
MNLSRLLWGTRLNWYATLIAGAVVIMGIVAVVTALFPSANPQTVAVIGAFAIGGVVSIAIYRKPHT